MNMDTPLLSSTRVVFTCIFLLVSFAVSGHLVAAEENVQAVSSPTTRTIVAEVLEVEGDFHIVRGERGEIRIEVTPDTQVSEEFIYGDRIKAVLLSNDVALSITRAAPEEMIGMKTNEPSELPPPPTPSEENPQASEEDVKTTSPLYKAYQVPKVRVVIANILMVDGNFYIIRSEHGEIQIEITPETTLSEDFQFDDKIKARITPANKALTVTRAGKDEPTSILEEVSTEPTSSAPAPPTESTTPTPEATESSKPLAPEAPETRIIVADVLMAEGDFYIVRGERGEIQIEVTPETTVSESFDYGDRIKAEVLPNDKALSIERAGPNDPVGITTP